MSSTSQLSPHCQTQVQPSVIDFTVGQPGPSILSKEAIDAAFAQVTSENDLFLYQYGSMTGSLPFLESLSSFLKVPRSQLVANGGISEGISRAARLLAKPGQIVFIEEPTYFLAGETFLS